MSTRIAETLAGTVLVAAVAYLGWQIVRTHPMLAWPAGAGAALFATLWLLSVLLRVGRALDDRDLRDQTEARRNLFAGHDPDELDFEPLPRRWGDR